MYPYSKDSWGIFPACVLGWRPKYYPISAKPKLRPLKERNKISTPWKNTTCTKGPIALKVRLCLAFWYTCLHLEAFTSWPYRLCKRIGGFVYNLCVCFTFYSGYRFESRRWDELNNIEYNLATQELNRDDFNEINGLLHVLSIVMLSVRFWRHNLPSKCCDMII